jgi:5S rRNA maturation endonuclease (ribonuclease M5)
MEIILMCLLLLPVFTKAADKNKDGKISYSEFLDAIREQTTKSLIEIIDPDAAGPELTIT